jgi:uncharacterized protein YndB with AHSA1/START domain
VPDVSRRRVIDAPVEAVWSVISDPYHLPRWWPRATRVENVRGESGGRRSQWTTVLETQSGRPVRADFRCLSAAVNDRFIWEQEVAETPFEKILRRSVVEIHLRSLDGKTEVRLESRQALRGLSRLGSPMMRRATARTLDQALDGLETAVG